MAPVDIIRFGQPYHEERMQDKPGLVDLNLPPVDDIRILEVMALLRSEHTPILIYFKKKLIGGNALAEAMQFLRALETEYGQMLNYSWDSKECCLSVARRSNKQQK